MPPNDTWRPVIGADATVGILLSLIANVALPFLFPCATGPLIQLYEYRFNMKTGASTEQCIDKTGAHFCDFTRINDDYVGYKNCYVYAACFCLPRPNMFHELLKYDDESGDIQVHNFGPGVFGGGATFAPRDGSSAEDDGYAICFTYDENTEQSECRIIDAQNFNGPPVARIKIPSRVPFGFHAGWAPAL